MMYMQYLSPLSSMVVFPVIAADPADQAQGSSSSAYLFAPLITALFFVAVYEYGCRSNNQQAMRAMEEENKRRLKVVRADDEIIQSVRIPMVTCMKTVFD